MGAVFKREFKSYFSSPIGYVFLAFLMFFSALFFCQTLYAQTSYLEYVFLMLTQNFIIALIPLLTMRLFSEEKKLKTDQLLMTAPVSTGGVVMGKYFAALLMFFISISPTILYVLILGVYTMPDWNLFVGNFLGLLLLGGALIAIGIFISALTESQMVAFIASFACVMFFMLYDGLVQSLPGSLSFLSGFLKSLSFMSRYQDFVSGILNVAHLLFFASVIAGFNFLTARVLEKKRWS